MWDDKDLKLYDKYGLEKPKQDKHGEDSWEHPISEKLEQANWRNWRQKGNQLICDTDFGQLTQSIPTHLILKGVDKNGNPILVKK